MDAVETLTGYFLPERAKECGLETCELQKRQGGPRVSFHPIQPEHPSRFYR